MTSIFGKTISTMFETAGNIDSKWKKFINNPIIRGSNSALQAVKGLFLNIKQIWLGLKNNKCTNKIYHVRETISGLFLR